MSVCVRERVSQLTKCRCVLFFFSREFFRVVGVWLLDSHDDFHSRARRLSSQSPSRERLADSMNGTSTPVRPLRRGRKPNKKAGVAEKSSMDNLDNSFNSSTTSFNHSHSSILSEDLDFLSKSPVGHQWRNKKLWQTNANATQKRYEEYSGKRICATPQGMEREMRRNDIKKSLMGLMELEAPDLKWVVSSSEKSAIPELQSRNMTGARLWVML